MVCWKLYHNFENWIGKIFFRYGVFVGTYPVIVLIVSMLVSGLLGIGMINLTVQTDVEKVYTPPNSQASQDRALLRDLFRDTSAEDFNSYSSINANLFGSVIFRRKDSSNMLSLENIREIEKIYHAITVNVSGNGLDYFQLCAVQNSTCAVDGDFIFSDEFQRLLQSDRITYPVLEKKYIESVFGDVLVMDGLLKSAKLIKLQLNLRQDTQTYKEDSKLWEAAFLTFMKNVQSDTLDVSFAHSTSLDEELSENIKGDILFVSITFTLMIVYATLVTTSCDPILDRQNLGRAGVLATGLSILASFGLGSACGVEFVSIAGVMPFLILGIGIDDMFILLAGLANAPLSETGPNRVGDMMRTSGVAVTITSLTDMFAFGIGASSVFPGVRNFCIYTGLAIFFCYINFVTFFVACVAINERRMGDKRHACTCMRIRLKDEMKNESRMKRSCCGGRKPSTKEDLESFIEKVPGKLLSKFVTSLPFKIVTLVGFAVYLGVSIYGVTKFKEGFDITNLVSDDSYFHEYNTLNQRHFTQRIPLSFTFTEPLQYSDTRTDSAISSLMTDVTSDRLVESQIQISWYRSYRFSTFFDGSSEANFVTGLKPFLLYNPQFKADILFDDSEQVIRASRIYVLTNDLKDSTEQGELMQRMRQITSDSTLPVTVFSPPFIFYEQYVVIVRSTLKTVGIAVLVIFVITALFMPSPLLILYVTVTMVMIMTGIFGFMYFWNLTLSSITMIHIIMSIGFSVDFSAHICHAYMTVEGDTRDKKVKNALLRAGGPILNGSVSSLLGILMLVFSQSYIFQSFFKVMLLVILIGMGHSLFFLPVVLSLVGPFDSRRSGKGNDYHTPNQQHNNHGNGTEKVKLSVEDDKNTSGNLIGSYQGDPV
ncbi:patched domain-containing protein 3-like [Ylistrum balloti]|uniref:patched domain-containing protein 3-like n=1 Tax=Ylistrum balloti TaxID=509963 RepID=UPI002905E786|nr:patched domain-containing protein 3-like [Ylistrum balloti]